jgi:GntR family transcriptional regulator, transcriptional repressor for pyruvate dehydrogenase complex
VQSLPEDSLEQDETRQAAYREGTPPIRLPKVAEIIAETIRRDIAKGVLREGDSLPAEAILIERFGVSKPTIREAFRILESETLIEVRRGASGARVRLPSEQAASRLFGTMLQLSGTTLDDVWHARLIFEPPLAAQLAESRTLEQLAQLRQLNADQRNSVSNLPLFSARVADFHQLVMSFSGNQTLASVSRLLDEVVRRQHMAVTLEMGGSEYDNFRVTAVEEHEEFVSIVERQDSAEAQRFWRDHLEKSAKIGRDYWGEHTVLDLFNELPDGGRSLRL